jgi:drug/metabolite transporter (DMT)-like permease
MWMYYVPALIAIAGSIGYHFFLKQLGPDINPIVSVIGLYLAVLIVTPVLFFLFPLEGGLLANMRQLNWIQVALALSVLGIELGFLLMYRAGWQISTGNIVTGVATNIALIVIGLLMFSEKLTPVQALGVVLSLVGVVLIQYKPAT